MRTLRDEMVECIEERIRDGVYNKGDQLKEMALVRELHVSRSPIREAFRVLEDKGLIEHIPNRGVFVK